MTGLFVVEHIAQPTHVHSLTTLLAGVKMIDFVDRLPA